MFRIGEFSKLVRVSARMLRYYDKCGLLRPASVDPFTDYRLYSAAQIAILMRITSLRDMGFRVEEIKKILPHYSDAAVMQAALDKKKHEVYATLSAEQEKFERIAAMRSALQQEDKLMVYDVEVKRLKAEKVLSLRETIPADQEERLWERLWAYVAQHNIAHAPGGYSMYYGDEYEEDAVDTEIAVPVTEPVTGKDGFEYKELAAIPTAATIRFSGPYEGYGMAMEKLAKWLEKNGYIIDGPVRGFAIAAPTDVASPEEYMTELQVPVKKE